MSRELGDFQTPSPLVGLILDRLEVDGVAWERVLEPTVGQGAFVSGLIGRGVPPREILGIEIQQKHLDDARESTRSATTRVELKLANLFEADLRRDLDWTTNGPILVIGNPPWVTNAELGSLDSKNLPTKSNIKRERGLDAKTGRANFDLAEAIWLKLIEELAIEAPSIALLCKTTVARNVLEHAFQRDLPIGAAWIARIDAQRWFKASVDACLFFVKIDPRRRAWDRIPLYPSLESRTPVSALGFAKGRMVNDIDAYKAFSRFDGDSLLEWRQGIKHDAADLMELTESPEPGRAWLNRRGQRVHVESEYVFPLLKGADLLSRVGPAGVWSVIVTQSKAGRATDPLRLGYPRLWAYLQSNRDDFRKRKSSIYQNAPEFAMFGVGPYSFAPFKVAIAGLSKTPIFHAIAPRSGKPTLFDDTCYFLPCQTAEQAAILVALLNSEESNGLIKTLMSPASKRSITKTLLRRIDLAALLREVDQGRLMSSAELAFRGLSGDDPEWPDDIESLLRPSVAADHEIDPFKSPMETSLSWPSPPSITSANR